MNEEEKKAIEYWKDYMSILHWNTQLTSEHYLKILLDLIEKLQKGNEELKNKKYMMTISCDGECQTCKHCENETIFENRIQELEKINEEHQELNCELRLKLNEAKDIITKFLEN